MLIEPKLVEVWCETQDDITLVWKRNGNFEIEFVQVKGAESDQLWSMAMLCGKQGKAKRSIFEKSFVNDRCRETVLFRMVTLRPVSSELKILSYDKGSESKSSSYRYSSMRLTPLGKGLSEDSLANAWYGWSKLVTVL